MGEKMQAEEKVNILLVDDRPEGLLSLEAILEPLGQNLVKARSGQEVLRHLLAQEFAVVLLDVKMPGMDGFETAALMRERASSRHTPIIFLTASYKTNTKMLHGYTVGAVDYLFKPFDPDILRSKISVFVELAKKSALIKKQTTELIEREHARQLAETRARLLLELQQKNRDLEVANKELQAFAYSVSHDLRAPLRSINGFSHALLEDYAERLDEDGKKLLRRVRESATRMAELIDGLLSLARVVSSELHRERIDLSRLAREAGGRLQSHQSARQVEFVVEDGLFGEGDACLLGIVLDNLLGNAWKFTAKRADARIEVGRSQQGGHPAFFVRDNGAGFDMTYAGKLFGAFQRLHAAREFEGHGIGLATVERIVRRHGGRIWAEAQVGRGATFYFTLEEAAEQK